MKKYYFIIFALFFCMQNVSAQIGYQEALLNTATGKPRAGETVNVAIELTNKKGETFYFEKQTATSNDFGVLSLIIGNENTFKNADWTKLPFFIGVAVDGVLIGKTQILSVPLAEVAKGGAPAFPIEDLLGTWTDTYEGETSTYTFREDYTFIYHATWDGYSEILKGKYMILGNWVFISFDTSERRYQESIISFFDKKFHTDVMSGFTK